MMTRTIAHVFLLLLVATEAFVLVVGPTRRASPTPRSALRLFSTEETKAAPLVSGEELEKMLTEWDQPLVVDAYATWYVSEIEPSLDGGRQLC
jgi:hypothetical protein